MVAYPAGLSGGADIFSLRHKYPTACGGNPAIQLSPKFWRKKLTVSFFLSQRKTSNFRRQKVKELSRERGEPDSRTGRREVAASRRKRSGGYYIFSNVQTCITGNACVQFKLLRHCGGLLTDIEDLPLPTHAAECSKDISVHPRRKNPARRRLNGAAHLQLHSKCLYYRIVVNINAKRPDKCTVKR